MSPMLNCGVRHGLFCTGGIGRSKRRRAERVGDGGRFTFRRVGRRTLLCTFS